jgi:hypothetical protein
VDDNEYVSSNERREKMTESKRMYRRFDLPLIVKFRPANGKTMYSLGLLKNISCEGLNLEARGFNFITHENLELELKFPQGNSSVSLSGDVMWKKQDGRVNYAGIKFRQQNEDIRNEIIEKISHHTSIPVESFFNKQVFPQKVDQRNIPPRPPAEKDVAAERPQKPGIAKKYTADGAKCSVTFRLPKEAAEDVRNVILAGDFNNWDIHKTEMTKLESGDFSVTLELDCDTEYKFKYFIDGSRWENDWHADKYVQNNFGTDDSVVIT